jgi:hypothetical protein
MIDIIQGSDEWLKVRLGKPTASEFSKLFTESLEPRKGEMPKTLLAQKVAELWCGPLPSFGTKQMEDGNLLEDEARPWYAFTYGAEVTTPGFILSDCERYGCSPDGLVNGVSGLEIKCPAPTTHVSYVLANKLPGEYAAQVHGSLMVTGLPFWDFVSYSRHMPPLTVRIERDESICSRMREIIEKFCADIDQANKTLKGLEQQ